MAEIRQLNKKLKHLKNENIELREQNNQSSTKINRLQMQASHYYEQRPHHNNLIIMTSSQ